MNISALDCDCLVHDVDVNGPDRPDVAPFQRDAPGSYEAHSGDMNRRRRGSPQRKGLATVASADSVPETALGFGPSTFPGAHASRGATPKECAMVAGGCAGGAATGIECTTTRTPAGVRDTIPRTDHRIRRRFRVRRIRFAHPCRGAFARAIAFPVAAPPVRPPATITYTFGVTRCESQRIQKTGGVSASRSSTANEATTHCFWCSWLSPRAARSAFIF